MGGRLTVGLQTLDLRIGVRIPASQPLTRKDLLDLLPFTLPRWLRLSCRLLRTCFRRNAVQAVNLGHVRAWNYVAIDVYRDLD